VEATLENVDACEVVVTVSVPAEEFTSELEGSFKNLSKNVRMKGFRPGKIPRAVLEKHHGEALRQETQQNFVQRGLQEIVAEKELRPVGQPRLTAEDLEVADDGGFTARVALSLRPEYKLGEYKGLEVEAPKVTVTDEEVETAIEQFKESQGRPEPAADGLTEDGMALASLELLDGEDSLMSRDGIRLSYNVVPPGLDEEAYKAALIGSKDGAVHDVPMIFPEDFQPEALRGKEGVCRITLAQVFDMQRPSDEDLLKMLGAEDLDEMKKKVHDDIERQKQAQVDAQVELNLLEKLISAHDIEMPARLIEDQVNNRKASFFQEQTQAGTSEDDAKAMCEDQEEAFRTEAIHNSKALFLLEDVAQAEELAVQNEDIARKFQEIAQRNQTSVEEVQKYYQENNLINQLAMEILELKVRAFLRENAKITEVDAA
jgi:trigger factor